MFTKILLIDDDEKILIPTKRLLETKGYDCEAINKFDEGIEKLAKKDFNIIITDYKDNNGDNDAGKKIIDKLQSIYFSPLIIYTGVLGSIGSGITDKQNSFFKIIEKGADSDQLLLKAVDDILASKEYKVKKEIEEETEMALKNNFKEYFWDIVHNYWSDFENIDEKTLKNVLLRKILNNIHQKYLFEEKINPIEFYEHPINKKISTGTIIEKNDNFYVCINNDCDLCKDYCKLNALIFLKIKDYGDILNNFTSAKGKSSFLNNNHRDYREDGFVFPKTFFFLGGYAYFDKITSLSEIKEGKIIIPDDVEFIAKVNQPFLSRLVSNFSRFYNRFGTPDIDVS